MFVWLHLPHQLHTRRNAQIPFYSIPTARSAAFKMTDKQSAKERPSKRSLTPNRSIYTSFNEAHRNIAPPTPKLPFEADLGNEEPLTPEQVEKILNDPNLSNSSRELEDKAKSQDHEHSSVINQAAHDTKITSRSSQSAVESQSKTTNYGRQASVSICGSEDEHAFLDTSVSSLQDSKSKSYEVDPEYDPFASQHAMDNYPDASSFYPEDGAAYSPGVSDDDFVPNHVKLDPESSPILASLPTLLPPVAASSQDPSQHATQSHFDDVTKKQQATDYFNTTHVSGQNSTQYPISFENGANPTPDDPSMPMSSTKDETKTESSYDGDISEVSEDQFIDQDKGKASSSRLNPFHAFSAAASSTQESEVNFEQVQPDSKKFFLRPLAEKDVSRALHCATGISQPSSGLIVGRTRPSHTSNSGLHGSPYKNGKPQQEGFYHAPAIQPSWKVTTSGVKVPVPNPYTGNDETNMRETQPYDTIDNTHMATMASTADERTRLDGDEDWRTVTDDREEFPTGAMGRVMTGSSIANVSDALLIRQQAQYQGRRPPSTTTAWWEMAKSTPVASPTVPSPTVPFPPMADLPTPIGPPSPVFYRNQRQNQFEEIELGPMSPSGAAQILDGNGRLTRFPFPLVAREDAARIQAVRRASGIEDQTLSGRMTSTGFRSSSIQDSSHFLTRPSLRKDSARSLFSRINNPNFDCRSVWTPENPFQRPATELAARPRASTAASRNWGVNTPRASAASSLATSQRDSRPVSPHLVSTEVAPRYEAFQAVRNAGGRGTDSELADMAATAGDAALSLMAQRRQRAYYVAVMAATLLLPMVGWAILTWHGDRVLSAITHGECSGLSYNQRRNLRMMLLGGCALWGIAVVVGLITTAATRA
ncbi:hypothetical protein CkaCkLH20_04130 [Colletotrichum karsti]|uniref:Uncharacterized protein n=1 Tax=Colletotrichum karsti TaxID=1095194 RepID=A0A9P6LMB2_9PEZI|nr:uncharacterized protein CkaCkLH20_04130 [Colletotrichum karsti]KAF9878638.1 hypothetical protein CkaCkLH20_04130 [Colletotrichum karsti]